MPCSSAILLKTCGPPMKASFGPTEALATLEAGVAWGGSMSPGAIANFAQILLACLLACFSFFPKKKS